MEHNVQGLSFQKQLWHSHLGPKDGQARPALQLPLATHQSLPSNQIPVRGAGGEGRREEIVQRKLRAGLDSVKATHPGEASSVWTRKAHSLHPPRMVYEQGRWDGISLLLPSRPHSFAFCSHLGPNGTDQMTERETRHIRG